jgi:small subunit ribosomal protein S21
MVTVEIRHGESGEQLLRRFRKKVQRARVMPAVRRKRWYMKPSDVRRLKQRKAIRRQRRREWRKERRQNRSGY